MSPAPHSPATAVPAAASSAASPYASITITGLAGARASAAPTLVALGEGGGGTSAAKLFSGSDVVFEAGTALFAGGARLFACMCRMCSLTKEYYLTIECVLFL